MTANSEQKYETGPIKWGHYKQIREKVVALTKDEVFKIFLSELTTFAEESEGKESLIKGGVEIFGKVTSMPDVVEMVLRAFDECTELLIQGCVIGGVDFELLSAPEVISLRDDCLNQSKIFETLITEKNFISGLLAELGLNMSSKQAATDSASNQQ